MGTGHREAESQGSLTTWPPNYAEVLKRRCLAAEDLEGDGYMIRQRMQEFYEHRPAQWIEDWCWTYDPRRAGRKVVPFILFERQREFIEFLYCLLMEQESGLVEKSRDVGATWLCCCFSVWAWLYQGHVSIGWGSREKDLVDKIGDVDSIFEKIRMVISYLPPQLLPLGYSSRSHSFAMKILNPETGASITGDAGDDIGRGGRKTMYLVDEAAHLAHPEMVEAALGDNTRVQVHLSSVNGLGNPFHRKREAGIEWYRGRQIPPGFTRVFIFDWRDHPEKTQEWYDQRRAKAERDGLLHKFAQEVDRDYSAAVIGTIIPAPWVEAAVDAHIKLGFEASGKHVGGLDVADQGMDLNAFAARRGACLLLCEDWGDIDPGSATRRAIQMVKDAAIPSIEINYDCVGVGAGVKSEANRLMAEDKLPKVIKFVPWHGGAKPLYPERYVVDGDRNTPKNKDFYANLKAQGWWQLRLRFERTYRAVKEGVKYDPDLLISLPSTLPNLRDIKKELSQPTRSSNPSLKLVVDKTPEGTRSPNKGDAIMMAYFPLPTREMPEISDELLLALGG